MSGTGADLVRAGVFVGVARSGDLPVLHDACQGARQMHGWALSQGMLDGKQAKLITDDSGKVNVDQIYTAIEDLLAGAGVDQLLVYFAGHGVNINRNETWLLSDAPRRTNAAVNVTGSVELARYCGVRHVVFISDACRSAPQGLQAQGVRGQDIVPNDLGGERARPVDQFFACVLGRTAAELADPVAAANTYKAVYTGAVLDALRGEQPQVLEASADAADPAWYVRPVPLQAYLEREVPARIRALGMHYWYNQQPEALLMAHPSWLSRIVQPPNPPPERLPHQFRERGMLGNLRDATRSLLGVAARGSDTESLRREVWKLEQRIDLEGEGIAEHIRDVLEPFGPVTFETGCGIKVRGATIRDCFTPRVHCEHVSEALIRVDPRGERAATVAVLFGGGSGTAVPVFAGYITALTMREGELVDVAFEPAVGDAEAGSWRESSRRVRAVVAAAVGNDRLDFDDETLSWLPLLDIGKFLDPALLLYAAYALRDRQEETALASQASSLMRERMGTALFDLALLGRQLAGRKVDLGTRIVPFTPLFSRGWALLTAHRLTLPAQLAGIESTILDSPWSLYSREGYELLRAALASGEVL